jgi:acyl-CoA thioester hydrolase
MPASIGTIPIRVRYAECDAMGVAHHSIYPVWFEMGRTELLRETGLTYRELEAAGVFLAVVKLAISYKRPARYDDELALETTLTNLGHVKIEHEYKLFRDETKRELLATASSTLACIDRDGKPQPLPHVLVESSARTAARQ